MQIEVRVMMEILCDGRVVERREISSFLPGAGAPGVGEEVAATVAAVSEPRRPAAQARESVTWSNRQAPGTGASPAPLLLSQGQSQTQDPVTSSTSVSCKSGWHGFIELVRGDGDLWSGYAGLSDEQICELGGVRREVRCLDLIGVRDPLQVVLQCGPERCKQVREWVKKLKRSQGVSNEAGLIAKTLSQGEPRSTGKAVRHASG